MGNTNRKECFYGWKKDKHDPRDFYHNFTLSRNHSSITKVDMRNQCPPVYDQEQLGSCTANAIGGAYEFDQMKEQEKDPFTPSRLYIYYNERDMEGTVNSDSGAEIRDGIKSINKQGVCPETMWPYDISKFTEKPSNNCYEDGKKHLAIEYKRVVQDLGQLKQCLIEGYPFVFGFEVYESFESEEVAKTGKMPMPKKGEKLLGGHAIMCVGFDDTDCTFICRNSWSNTWGDQGYFYMPYDYMTSDKCGDFWTVRRVVDDDDKNVTVCQELNCCSKQVKLEKDFKQVKLEKDLR